MHGWSIIATPLGAARYRYRAQNIAKERKRLAASSLFGLYGALYYFLIKIFHFNQEDTA